MKMEMHMQPKGLLLKQELINRDTIVKATKVHLVAFTWWSEY